MFQQERGLNFLCSVAPESIWNILFKDHQPIGELHQGFQTFPSNEAFFWLLNQRHWNFRCQVAPQEPQPERHRNNMKQRHRFQLIYAKHVPNNLGANLSHWKMCEENTFCIVSLYIAKFLVNISGKDFDKRQPVHVDDPLKHIISFERSPPDSNIWHQRSDVSWCIPALSVGSVARVYARTPGVPSPWVNRVNQSEKTGWPSREKLRAMDEASSETLNANGVSLSSARTLVTPDKNWIKPYKTVRWSTNVDHPIHWQLATCTVQLRLIYRFYSHSPNCCSIRFRGPLLHCSLVNLGTCPEGLTS